MELITLTSADHLKRFFEDIGTWVGPRRGPNRRTQDQMEFFNLRQFLTTLAADGQFEFPLTIEKGQSPDFMLAHGGGERWGLEVTEATTKGWQRELTETERNEECSEATLVSLGRGDGWVGDSAERETCAAILRAMRRKAMKIRSGKYRPASRYDVLIYVNVRAFFYDFDATFGLLVQRVARWKSQWTALGQVHVITSLFLFSDVTGSLKKLPLVKIEVL